MSEREQEPLDIRAILRRRLVVDLTMLAVLVGAIAGGFRWYYEWKAERKTYVRISDAVAIHKVAVQAMPEPIRSAVASVNIRDIIADNRGE